MPRHRKRTNHTQANSPQRDRKQERVLALYKAGHVDKALTFMHRFKMNTFEADLLKAKCYQSKHEYTKAEDILEKLSKQSVKESAKHNQVLLAFGYLYMNQIDRDKNINQANYEKAKAALFRIPLRHQTQQKIFCAWLDLFWRANEYDLAKQKLSEFEKIRPRASVRFRGQIAMYELEFASFLNEPISNPEERFSLLLKGLNYYKKSKIQKLKYLGVMIRAFKLVKNLESIDTAKIKLELEATLNKNPTNVKAHYLYAAFFKETKQYDLARKQYQFIHGHKKFKYHWESEMQYLYLLGELLGEWEAAIKLGEQILARIQEASRYKKPSLSYQAEIEFRMALAFFNLGQSKNFDTLKMYHEYLDKAYEHDPNNHSIESAVGHELTTIRSQKINHDVLLRAAEHYQQAARLNPQRREAHALNNYVESNVSFVQGQNEKNDEKSVSSLTPHSSSPRTLTFANFQKPLEPPAEKNEHAELKQKRKKKKTEQEINIPKIEFVESISTKIKPVSTSEITKALLDIKPVSKPRPQTKMQTQLVTQAASKSVKQTQQLSNKMQAPVSTQVTPTQQTWAWNDSCCGMFKFFGSAISNAYNNTVGVYYSSFNAVQNAEVRPQLNKKRR